jgi:hypothetical protein
VNLNENNKKIKQIEKDILELLVNSKREEILDNEKLVNILVESKRVSE